MTKFRGCIDIHSGQVKQIVGGTLTQDDVETSTSTTENFVSTKPLSHYAELYKADSVFGSHVIKLGSNPSNDEAAKLALRSWPQGLQIGGGITDKNALEWLDKHGASHVIVTSWLFPKDEAGKPQLDWTRLKSLSELVGKNRLVVDLSCRKLPGKDKTWVVAIDKWQTLTDIELSASLLLEVGKYCSEFLIHAADVEGLCKGIDLELVEQLGIWCPPGFEGNCVYAGGARLAEDLETVRTVSAGKVDLTYGSSLDIFGGNLVKYEEVVEWNRRQ